jgi:hypothetical protein
MARKTNSTKSKRRRKSGRRKDYTRATALKMRSAEARVLAGKQREEIFCCQLQEAHAARELKAVKQAAHAARHREGQ